MAGVDAGVEEEEGAPKIGIRWARTASLICGIMSGGKTRHRVFPWHKTPLQVILEIVRARFLLVLAMHTPPPQPRPCTPQKTKTKNDDDAEAGKEDDDTPANREGGQGRGRASPKTGTETLLLAECAREAHLWTHTAVTESVGPAKIVCARPCFLGVV